MAPAFLRGPEKAILDGVREHAINDQGTMTTTSDAQRADERAHARRDALLLTITGPLVATVLIVAWLATGAGYFWPIWPMLGWGVGVASHGLAKGGWLSSSGTSSTGDSPPTSTTSG